jgi:hypothetical protein
MTSIADLNKATWWPALVKLILVQGYWLLHTIGFEPRTFCGQRILEGATPVSHHPIEEISAIVHREI